MEQMRQTYVKPYQGEASPTIDTSLKMNDSCYYCGNFGHFSKYYTKGMFHESKYRNKIHTCHFTNSKEIISDDLKLFISDVALLAEIDDCNAWFIDSSASIQMTCHKNRFVNYHKKPNGAKIYLGDDRCHEIKCYGGVCVTLPSGHVNQIKNVMYVSELRKK